MCKNHAFLPQAVTAVTHTQVGRQCHHGPGVEGRERSHRSGAHNPGPGLLRQAQTEEGGVTTNAEELCPFGGADRREWWRGQFRVA